MPYTGIYDMTKAPQGKAGSASDVFNATKATLTKKAMKTTLARYQIELNQPDRHPQKTTSGQSTDSHNDHLS